MREKGVIRLREKGSGKKQETGRKNSGGRRGGGGGAGGGGGGGKTGSRRKRRKRDAEKVGGIGEGKKWETEMRRRMRRRRKRHETCRVPWAPLRQQCTLGSCRMFLI